MAANKPANRETIAMTVIIVSIFLLIFIGAFAIMGAADGKKGEAAIDVMTMVLPVVATWVGTVIAFYFGRENFEAANEQVNRLVERIPGGQKVQSTISSIMRTLAKTTHIRDSNSLNLDLQNIKAHFTDQITRIIIVDDDNYPKYVIHESRIDNYLNDGRSASDTLDAFLENRKAKTGFGFEANAGFVTVAKDISIAEAKRDMQAVAGCQDIIITEKGGDREPMLGWVSNTRLTKALI